MKSDDVCSISASGNNTDASLTEGQLAQYRNDGYLVLRGFTSSVVLAQISEEATTLRGRNDLVKLNNLRCRWQRRTDSNTVAFDAFDPVIDVAPAAARFAADARLQQLLWSIYGEPGYLFRDKLIYKESGSAGYPLHQDFISGTTFPSSVLTVVLAIDPATSESGCIEVYPGMHLHGYLVDDRGSHRQIDEHRMNGLKHVPLILDPGDIAVFPCFTPHRSGTNKSARMRRQLYLSYTTASDGENRRAQHYAEFHRWLTSAQCRAGITDSFFA